MAVEVRSLPENQQENGTKICHMPGSLEQWRKTQYRAETKNPDGIKLLTAVSWAGQGGN